MTLFTYVRVDIVVGYYGFTNSCVKQSNNLSVATAKGGIEMVDLVRQNVRNISFKSQNIVKNDHPSHYT